MKVTRYRCVDTSEADVIVLEFSVKRKIDCRGGSASIWVPQSAQTEDGRGATRTARGVFRIDKSNEQLEVVEKLN